MLKLFFRALTVMMLAGTLVVSAQRIDNVPIQGVVRVKLQPELTAKVGHAHLSAAPGQLSTGIHTLDATLRAVKGSAIRPVFPYSEKYASERARFGLDQWYEVTISQDIDVREASRLLGRTPGVVTSSVRTPMTLQEGKGGFRPLAPDAPLPAATAQMPFNDPRLPSQWHYYNDGSVPGTVAGADINLFKAWEVTTGSPDVIVAIIDGGIDYTHEDLAAHVLINEAELNGTPGVDDDGNGYVDDIYGYNFCTNNADVYPHSHGTHVAGTVAAVNNNGKGVAGVAGGDGTADSGVRLVSCQTFDSRSGAGVGDFAAAFVYAAERGASIAQCSWGWDSPEYYEEDVLDAIRYFVAMNRTDKITGGIAIFASGNEGLTGNCYPACMDEVIAVASMQGDYIYAPYSNYGEWVDIVAPGGYMDFDSRLGVLSTLPDNMYGFNEGTSMAAPHVSGIAALVLSKYGRSSFPASTLRQQILNSVNDFYAYNPTKRGLYGSGYADAAKALVMGDGTAPSAVDNFELLPSQDLITVEWTIPASSTGDVNHHIIYYSTTEFGADDALENIPSKIADTRFLASGDKCTYEVTGLKSLTTYYIALQAVDRWGNASELSPVKQATTNAGSQMTLDVEEVDLDFKAGSSKPTATFHIGNEDAGLLKWSVSYTRTAESSISYASINGPANVGRYSGQAGMELAAATQKVPAYENFDQDDYPKSFSNAGSIYAYIGDNDMSLPNAMAQQFTVDGEKYPDGFNLTHVSMLGSKGVDPEIEIYSGKGIFSQSNLLVRFKPEIFAYRYDVPLPEQMKFAPGENFWVVVKFPVLETLYPLGMGLSNGSASAKNAYMSNDNGATWSLLSQVLEGSRYQSMADRATWCITAVSKNPDWSEILTLTPSSGSVKQGETQTVKVGLKSTNLCNGNYAANVYFDTNESTPTGRKLRANISVTGQKPEMLADKVVNFGSLLVGQSKTIEVELYNKGYGTFAPESSPGNIFSTDIVSSSEHFTGPEYVPGGFPPRQASTVKLTYSPQAPGSHTGSIVFNGPAGQKLKIMVTGAATEPGHIEVTPSVIEIGDLNVSGSSLTREFTVSNTGNYPLEFVLPKYSDEEIEGTSGLQIHRFGYTWESNITEGSTLEYTGVPDMTDAVDITSQFTDDEAFSAPVDLGFEFPYYGKTYNKVYVTSFGGVVFVHDPGEYVNMYGPLTPGSNGVPGSGLICAYGFQLQMDQSSKVEYARVDGNFVLNFSNVMAVVYGSDYTPISFHMTLCPDGDVYVEYDDYNPWSVFQSGKGLFLALNDIAAVDPIVATSSDVANGDPEYATHNPQLYTMIESGAAFHFMAPRPNIVSAVNPAYGLLAPGESTTLKATVKAPADINAGPTFTNLIINSTDPLNSPTFVKFTANITGDLKGALTVNQKEVNFGKVFRTSDAKARINVANTGRNTLHVSSATLASGKMALLTEAPFDIPAKQSKDIVVVLPTDKEGAVEDVLTITSDEGEAKVSIKGEVTGVPELTLSYEALEEVLPYGETKSVPLTVTNTGNEPLEVAVEAGSHLSYNPVYGEGTGVTYSVVSSSANFEWIDITGDERAEHSNITALIANDFVTVDLPFTFHFYGVAYNKMYVCNTGFVSFTDRGASRLWPEPPAEFPRGTTYTNIIAPYWGLHSPSETRTSGIYVLKEEDRVIVTWKEYGNSMNYGVDFQLIMYPDGTFRFQYMPDRQDAQLFALFGCAGISPVQAASGLRLPARYVNFGNAVDFAPLATTTVAPGQTIEADITLSADDLAGEYESSIKLTTNVPTSPEVEIPVTLTVTGEAKPVLPADMTVENAAGFRSTDYTDPLVQMGAMYAAYFEVGNTGSAPFVIESIDIESPKGEDPWMGYEYDLLSLFYYGEIEDFFTGGTTKGWMQTDGTMPIEVRRESIRFAVPMLECEEAFIPGTYTLNLTLHLAGAGSVTEVPMKVNFVVTPAPEIGLDKEEIRVTAENDDHQSVETVKISNTGEYVLRYELRVDPTGKGEEIEEPGGGIMPMATAAPDTAALVKAIQAGSIRPNDTGKNDNVLDMPQVEDFKYTNALYYPSIPGTTAIYNYGSNTTYGEYKASTLFTAPEGGFNISHVYTMITFDEYENVDFTVEIIKGDNPGVSSPVVLGKGVYHHGEKYTSDMDRHSARGVVIPLQRPVFVNEGEEFCIVVTFPKGNKYPSTLSAKADGVVSNRYMGYVESYGWFDVASLFSDQYGSLGYVLTAIQTTEGSTWISLAPDQAERGELQPGEEADIRLALAAAAAPMESGNTAILVIKSNDPATPVINFPVYLDKNCAPVITVPSGSLVVKEGEKLNVSLTVKDPEGDAMVIGLDDNGGTARIVSVTSSDSSTEVTMTEDGMSATVTPSRSGVKMVVGLTPDFGDAGNYSFTVTATDAKGHEGTATVGYAVERSNRAPVAKEIDPIVVAVGGASVPLIYDDLFTDPDGDELTYSISLSAERIVTLYTAEGSVVFGGSAKGSVTAYITATDPFGASAVCPVEVVVSNNVGIDGIEVGGDIRIYPNPVRDVLNVACGFSDSGTTFTIYSLNGAAVISESTSVAEGDVHTVDMSALASGTYVLHVALSNGATASYIVIKVG